MSQKDLSNNYKKSIVLSPNGTLNIKKYEEVKKAALQLQSDNLTGGYIPTVQEMEEHHVSSPQKIADYLPLLIYIETDPFSDKIWNNEISKQEYEKSVRYAKNVIKELKDNIS